MLKVKFSGSFRATRKRYTASTAAKSIAPTINHRNHRPTMSARTDTACRQLNSVRGWNTEQPRSSKYRLDQNRVTEDAPRAELINLPHSNEGKVEQTAPAIVRHTRSHHRSDVCPWTAQASCRFFCLLLDPIPSPETCQFLFWSLCIQSSFLSLSLTLFFFFSLSLFC